MKKESNAAVAEMAQGVSEVTAGKHLTFELAGEVYGLEILKVQEIIGMMSVTSVPQSPDFVRGVVNLRGRIIPVMDLRIKFGIEGKEDTERTCIIVIQVTSGDHELITGLIVDEVSEVLEIREDQIEPPPSFGASLDTDFILGMGKVDRKVIMILDADKVLSDADKALVRKATAATAKAKEVTAKAKEVTAKAKEVTASASKE